MGTDELLAKIIELDAAMTPGPWFHNGLQTDDLGDKYRIANAIFNTDGGGDPVPHHLEKKLVRCPDPEESKTATAEESNINLRGLTAIRNLLPAIAAALRTGGWLPIAEAPKDGTKFLAFTADFYRGIRSNEKVQEARWIGKSADDLAGCFMADNGQMVIAWQPLPKPPA